MESADTSPLTPLAPHCTKSVSTTSSEVRTTMGLEMPYTSKVMPVRESTLEHSGGQNY